MHLSSISRLFAIRMTKSVETFDFYTPGSDSTPRILTLGSIFSFVHIFFLNFFFIFPLPSVIAFWRCGEFGPQLGEINLEGAFLSR